jgi:hypothetical protein
VIRAFVVNKSGLATGLAALDRVENAGFSLRDLRPIALAEQVEHRVL